MYVALIYSSHLLFGIPVSRRTPVEFSSLLLVSIEMVSACAVTQGVAVNILVTVSLEETHLHLH